MKWNVFSLEAVKAALKPKFVLEKVRYVTDDEEYGEGESTRLVFRNVEEMPEIDCKTVNAMSFAEYSYESEFESYESSFVSYTHRQAKTDLERLRCVF